MKHNSGYAIIQYATPEAANAAVQNEDKKPMLTTKKMKVKIVETKVSEFLGNKNLKNYSLFFCFSPLSLLQLSSLTMFQ